MKDEVMKACKTRPMVESESLFNVYYNIISFVIYAMSYKFFTMQLM